MLELPPQAWSFATRSVVHALPTHDRLKTFYNGERKCCRCHQPLTLIHILNACDKRKEGGYRWRHNNVLDVLIRAIRPYLPDWEAHWDWDGHTETVPAEVVATTHRPDGAFYLMAQKRAVFVELTCPFETNMADAHWRKVDRAKDFKRVLHSNGWKFEYFCVEVSSRGVVSKGMDELFAFLKMPKRVRTQAIREMVEVVLMCLYVLFFLADEKEDPPFNRVMPQAQRERLRQCRETRPGVAEMGTQTDQADLMAVRIGSDKPDGAAQTHDLSMGASLPMAARGMGPSVDGCG